MYKFLTIAESALLTGKSEKTIRRIIKKVTTHIGQDRVGESTPEIRLEKRPNGFIYLINQEILEKYLAGHFGEVDKGRVRQNDQSGQVRLDKDIEETSLEKEKKQVPSYTGDVQILLDYVETLKKQLDTRDFQINELIKRNSETNILLKGLQNKLFLLEQPKAEEPRNDQTEPAKKSSFLSRLFGKKQS